MRKAKLYIAHDDGGCVDIGELVLANGYDIYKSPANEHKPHFDFSRRPDSGEIAAGNGWHERGDLPPVETVCEITHNGHLGFWRKVEIIKYYLDAHADPEDQRMIVVDMSGYGDFVVGNPYIVYGIKDNDFKFRPLKSERERAIEEMLPILASLDGTQAKAEIACGKLYDLGFRKEGK